jgi:hypothetical protein
MTKPLARTAGGPPLSAVLGRGDIGLSLLAIFPLFLIYQVGVAFTPVMNGVDFVSRNLFALVDYSRNSYLLVHGGLAVVFVVIVLIMRRGKDHPLAGFLPMVLESAVYALTLGSLIVFVMRKLFGLDPHLAVGGLGNVLLSFGAGVHEELVFRLGLCAGGAALLRVLGVGHRTAVAFAFFASSLLFSAAHHIGALGDPWSLQVFVYRSLAGLLFAAIFYFRSLAHAAYTHALYDVYVLVLQS